MYARKSWAGLQHLLTGHRAERERYRLLEREMQGQLKNSRLVACLEASDLAKGAVAKQGIRICQVSVIKDIQGFGPELQSTHFSNLEILQEGCIRSC